MTALIALQLRLIWRAAPYFLKFAWFFLLLCAVGLFAADNVERWQMGMTMMVAFFFIVGGLVATGSVDGFFWLAPLRQSARMGTRLVLLGAGGLLCVGLLLGLHAWFRQAPIEPWPRLALHLWLCWVAGGFLVFVAGDLTRDSHPAVNGGAILISVAPAMTLMQLHVNTGLPALSLLAEGIAAVALFWLNFVVTRHQEMFFPKGSSATDELPSPAPMPPATVRPVALPRPSRIVLDHTADPSPVLHGSLFSYASTWIYLFSWLAIAFLPIGLVYAWFAMMVMSMALRQRLEHWRPFQATPLPRRVAFRWLIGPVLGFWALTVIIQCATVSMTSADVLDERGETFELPSVLRESREKLPAELRGARIPEDPREAAALLSRALKVSYGLDVPASEILARRSGVDPWAWLKKEERRWTGTIRWRQIQGRLAAGFLVAAYALFTLVWMLRGRWSETVIQLSATINLLVWMGPFAVNYLHKWLPEGLWSIYGAVFDRPWAFAAAMAVLSAALLVRHYRVFCTSAVHPAAV